MLELKFTAKFKKDYKKAQRQGCDLDKLHNALNALCRQEELPVNMRDHLLTGNYAGHRECRLEPNWLLIYRIDADAIVLTAARTGSRSDLFGM